MTLPERHDVRLAPLTTLRLGGPAARMVTATTDDEVREVFARAGEGDPVLILGGGSNVVIADEGFGGLVVRMGARGVRIERERQGGGGRVRVEVAAGEVWDELVTALVEAGLSGIESLAGIPGLVGATPMQNVGAYGHDVGECLERVRAFDTETGRVVEIAAAACAFGYRTSVFRGSSRYVILGVTFRLEETTDSAPVVYAELARALGVKEGARAPSKAVRDTVLGLRRSKGMVVDPADPDSVSAGSFFVNPTLTAAELAGVERRASRGGALRPGEIVPRFAAGEALFKVPAAWLVERAGFPKGFGAGRVGVSAKHALALVNRGGGTTAELLDLARAIRAGVRAAFGVELHAEPVFVGCSLGA